MQDAALATLAADYAAALDWWRMAGVDGDFTDAPVAWLRPPRVEAEPAPAPPPRTVPRPAAAPALERALAGRAEGPIGGERGRWPTDLAGFREFWLGEPSLDPGALADRVPPRGAAGAALMVLIGQPDERDRAVLLTGEQGRMLRALLRAMGLGEEETYLASALPRPAPLPHWEELAARGFADLTRHHIALARPRRIVAFGRGPALLAGEAGGVPLLAAPSLEALAQSGPRRRRFWQAWLEWSR